MQLALGKRSEHQVVLDITCVVAQRLLHRARQLSCIAEHLLNRMPQQIRAAHVEQMFRRGIEIADA